jgi:anti-sigma regulatory factor (Ser/Thr protein kinase)
MTGVECRWHAVPLPSAVPPPLAQVRALVAGLAADLPTELSEDLLLVVTELVANAYEHGAAPRTLRVERSDERGQIVIEVEDGTSTPPVVGRSRLGPNRGRGLTIVAGVAERWGVQALRAGKSVWALLRVDQHLVDQHLVDQPPADQAPADQPRADQPSG